MALEVEIVGIISVQIVPGRTSNLTTTLERRCQQFKRQRRTKKLTIIIIIVVCLHDDDVFVHQMMFNATFGPLLLVECMANSEQESFSVSRHTWNYGTSPKSVENIIGPSGHLLEAPGTSSTYYCVA
jgi:hypothetical protein